jgi:O-antigen/teichoic acid export membrane protein
MLKRNDDMTGEPSVSVMAVGSPVTYEPAAPVEKASNPQRNSVYHGALILGLGTISVTCANILLTRIYAKQFGPEELSAALLFRLYSSALVALSSLGMPIAIQRTVAYLGNDQRRAATTAITGTVIGLTVISVAAIACSALAPSIARLLDHAGAASLWQAFMALTLAQAFCTIVALTEVARGRHLPAAIVAFLGYGLSPLLPFVFVQGISIASATFWAAGLATLFTVPFFLQVLAWSFRTGIGGFKQEALNLLRYGLPRTVSGTVEPALDLALPWLAVVAGAGLLEAGNLAIGLALLRPLNPITGALNQVLIPASARLAALRDDAAQTRQTHQILEWSIQIGIFATLQLVLWADVLVRLWLGSQFAASVWVIRIVCLAFAPAFVYAAVRGIIDGAEEQPINTLNLLRSALVLLTAGLLARLLGFGAIFLASGYVLARFLLGWLSLRFAERAHSVNWKDLRLFRSIMASLALLALSMALRYVTPERLMLAGPFLCGLISTFLFTKFMAGEGSEWAIVFLRRLRLSR